ncbi:hypothetical protein I4641_03960 [Waterburya agarophytonicola K14]|uniref:Uncharacterized protein n=1 Tax=Waterburya agarophytonicola KI4 TaxID=2874699 RepID=A0A964BQU9_9CYAN|nr:hypothetical protein [Waterburya agarophytonicola]MCC0176135.1 hypothetical protein [Waterburya agarophytonicola KI4]
MLKNNRYATNRVIILLVGLLFLGYCLLTVLPWNPTGYKFDLDSSWATALHVAFANRIQFGRDFVYTYGPYGFLQVDLFFKETYGFTFSFRCLIAIAVWAGLFRIGRHCASRRDGSIFFLIPVLFFFPNDPIWMDFFQFTVITLPLVLYFYLGKGMTPSLVLTIMTVALASLVKSTYLVICIFFIGAIAIDEIGRLKRIPQVASVYLAFMWVFWGIAAQDFANIPKYVVNSLEIISGFSSTMGLGGSNSEIFLYALSTGIFFVLVAFLRWKKDRWWGILPSLSLAVLFFVTFKGAFTRHDAHALQAFFDIIPVVSIFTALEWSSISKTGWSIGKKLKFPAMLAWGMSLLLLSMMGATVLNRYLNYSYKDFGVKIVQEISRKIPQAAKVISGTANLAAISEQNKDYVRGENPLPAIAGSVDLYPNEIGSIFAYDFDYKPRPVFQSFSAYTSKLARLNVEHLRQADAAKNIFFDIRPIDQRLGSFEDGLSWPEMLTLYDITQTEGRYLLLQRSDRPRQYELETIGEKLATLGEWINLDDANSVWGEVKLKPNFWGKLAKTALRLPHLYLEVETANGNRTQYTMLTDVMSEGFLLSPILSNRWDFLEFAIPNWQQTLARKKVKKFRIIAPGNNSWFYPSTYQLQLSQLQFPRQDRSRITGWQEASNRIIPEALNGVIIRTAIDGENTAGWMAHAPNKLTIEVGKKQQNLSFSFGILPKGVDQSLQENAGDGVEFRIITLESKNRQKILFSRQLQPRTNPEDRGIHRATIDLSQIDTQKLILETISGKNSRWDWSYWSNITAGRW